MKRYTLAAIENARNELEDLKQNFLREREWVYSSSNNPGCFWVWTKEWNGKTLMGGTDFALKLQEQMEE